MQWFKPKLIRFNVTIFVVAVIGFVSFSTVTEVFAANAPDTSAKISFTFDDGLSSALLAAQTLQTYGYTGTDYVITQCVGMKAGNTCEADTTKNYMSWSDISALKNTYGWEIGSHTVTHPLLSTLTVTGMDSELSQSQFALQTNLAGYSALDFALPYGDYNNDTLAIAAKYYNSLRAFQDLTFGEAATNTFPYYSPRSSYPYNNYLLTVLSVQGDVPVATVESYIAQAKANNQWLIMVFHEIKADTDTTYDPSLEAYEYTTSNLGAIAAYAKSLSVPVVNISNGLAAGSNIVPGSAFNNGIADGWTTDSPTTIVADKQTSVQTGHGSYDGTATGALNSVHLMGSAVNTHLFSPRVAVTPGITYTLKNFVNVVSSSGEIDFYIDEYDAAGNDLKTGHEIQGVIGTTDVNVVRVGNVNFLYTPTSANVASARLQVIALGSGVSAYVDNLEWLSPNGQALSPVASGVVGDVNSDSLVDALDLSAVLSNWNKTGQTRVQGDLNGDGVVDALDLSAILTNWSK